ncbi:hypothetical protein J2Y45_000739 [Dyadobacter sp. BE34]|uniref:DUF4595 domain-containing protein n=1 Tax=Dyadobacter fermentans TaxID=94254 RepID=A0ABU1QS20_9BACT|nr:MULTISPECIES: hypothetical protein [Dyadobacter]MDR6803469.1 hypothetical protein [Dyadobacter fermentans]MDR7041210.1 hypothetical protein [Dyadobacter sp. BE242]MDR7195613.1 hypothetical protein [Dyadobacter sp. BE34]MDR7213842.1 hypothetical protein [Dyadobacter sp. BE31]MDR7261020.1 hypothetical protein [Dyadobacter sp. BE32]
MEAFQIAGKITKGLLLAALLAGCQNDQITTPSDVTSTVNNNQNAKMSAEVFLVKDGENSLQYLKFGKFAGKLWKVIDTYSYTEYTYDDSSGDLWITSKKYAKSNNKLANHKTYHIVNGRCVASKDLTSKFAYEYKYNVQGSLIEIKRYFGAHVLTQQFSYKAILPNTQRLDKITYIGESGPFMEYKFSYSAFQDKYFLNPYHTQLDKYLRIFGTFSDKLVQDVITDYLDGTASSSNYIYTLNADGYVTTRTDTYYPNIYEPTFDVLTDSLSYVTAWPGL